MTANKTKAELFLCDGRWNSGEEFSGMVICSGSWNGKADHMDEKIFYYTDGEPVIGEHGDFVITTAELMGDYHGEEESEDALLVSVTFEHFTHDDLEAGEPSERGYDVERETVDWNTLERYAQDYGVHEASSSQPSEFVWFSSTSPREDREHFEQGIHKYYSLHVHEINGEKPTAEDMQRIADFIGVRFDQPLSDTSIDSNRARG